MENQLAHHASSDKKRLLLIGLPIILVIVALFLIYLQTGKNALNVTLFQKGPNVSVKTEYKNPFDKDTQYVNPFETYKNPFVVSK